MNSHRGRRVALVLVAFVLGATSCGSDSPTVTAEAQTGTGQEQSTGERGDAKAGATDLSCDPVSDDDVDELLAQVVSEIAPDLSDSVAEALVSARGADEALDGVAEVIGQDAPHIFGTSDREAVRQSLSEWLLPPAHCTEEAGPLPQSAAEVSACVAALEADYRARGMEQAQLLGSMRDSAASTVAVAFEDPVPAAEVFEAFEAVDVIEVYYVVEGYTEGTSLWGARSLADYGGDAERLEQELSDEILGILENTIAEAGSAKDGLDALSSKDEATLEESASSLRKDGVQLAAVVVGGGAEMVAHAATHGPDIYALTSSGSDQPAVPILRPDNASLHAFERLCADPEAAARRAEAYREEKANG